MLWMSERFMSGMERERSGTERNVAERERERYICKFQDVLNCMQQLKT